MNNRKIACSLIMVLAFGSGLTAQTFIDVGDNAPDFELVSLTGDTVRLSDFLGSPVLLNFFGFNCGPCILEAPLIEQTWNIYKERGLVVLGINIWSTGQTIESVLNYYVNPTGTSYPVLLSGEEVGVAYGANVEDYFVIDENGIVTLRAHTYHVGNMHGAIDELLIVSDIKKNETAIPAGFGLKQNYPNPFNPETTILFELDNIEPIAVKIRIYNIMGKVVATLVDQNMTSGVYEVRWNSSAVEGGPVTSGIYYYELQAGGRKQVRKMTLLR